MSSTRWIGSAAIVVGAVLLPACGKIFPFGERLLPATYGPPFGSALKENLPKHPHNPATEERHAAADSAESRHYGSHAACHAALTAAVSVHAGGQVERISSIESIGLYRAAGIVHEQRCSDYVLSERSWCARESAGAGHGEAHKRTARNIAKSEDPACGGEASGHATSGH